MMSISSQFQVGDAPFSIANGNFNGDANEDLAVANKGSDDVTILLGNGDGTFQLAGSYEAGNSPSCRRAHCSS